MSKQRLIPVLIVCLVAGFASSAAAATTWKRLGANPFYRPALTSEADLGALVKNRSADLKAGFAKAGRPDLYPVFVEQFPNARIEPIKVMPGETFMWMLFKKRTNGRLVVAKDVTWGGAASFDAYRFSIDKDGQRYVFVVPYVCGNFTLRSVAPVPPPPAAAAPMAPVAVAAPAPPPVAPAPVVAAPAPVAVAPVRPAPVVAPAPPPVAPKVVAAAPIPPPVAPKPVPVAPPAPMPVAKPHGGPLFDVGLSREPDPANYAFARMGYEIPLTDKLYLLGLVGGYLRWMGNDGDSAFTADALLDYHWWDRVSIGLGAGYWSGNDGQLDLLANVGFRLFGAPEGSNTSIFIEARLPADELDDSDKFGRFGLGLRFRL